MTRRAEGIPLLVKKFQANAETCFPKERVEKILGLFEDVKRLEQMAVDEFVEQFVAKNQAGIITSDKSKPKPDSL